jgi:hypothetical protein
MCQCTEGSWRYYPSIVLTWIGLICNGLDYLEKKRFVTADDEELTLYRGLLQRSSTNVRTNLITLFCGGSSGNFSFGGALSMTMCLIGPLNDIWSNRRELPSSARRCRKALWARPFRRCHVLISASMVLCHRCHVPEVLENGHLSDVPEMNQYNDNMILFFHSGSLLRFKKTKWEYQDYGPRFSMVIGLAQLFNSARESTLYILLIAFPSKLKTGKPYIWAKSVNMSYLTGRVSGLHISRDRREWPRSRQANPLVKIKASPFSSN